MSSAILVIFCRNIVATVNLDCWLDLKTIALHTCNAEYNPKVCPFDCQKYAVVDPLYSVLLLSSCAFWIRRPQPSYSPQAIWSSPEPSLNVTRDWRRRSMHTLYKNLALMPNSPSSRSRTLLVAATSSPQLGLKGWRTIPPWSGRESVQASPP